MVIMQEGTAPGRVLVAGDWHGNSRWACFVIGLAAQLLAGEAAPLVLHCGDFGVWPGAQGATYLTAVRGACRDHGVRVRFIDGNHECFPLLDGLRVTGDDQLLGWLPRGSRWRWHGRTWLALGGAVSLDKGSRTEGLNWWPEEEITSEQAAAVIAGGPADVMITHDVPAGVRHSFPPAPSFWDLACSDAHRERLQGVVDAVRPRYLVHGHLHRCYQRERDFGYGPVEVTGLDRDGDDGNYAVLDVRDMTWSERD